MKKTYVFSQIKKMRYKHNSSIPSKNINFITEDLQLVEKNKRSRVKWNKPIPTCLDNTVTCI